MPQIKDLTDQRFGKLTVLGFGERKKSKSGFYRIYWNCICECGKLKSVEGSNLKCGLVLSCGCSRKGINSKHGESRDRLYSVWCGIKCRCMNKRSSAYENYGGRGIKICEEWKSYEVFAKWARLSGYDDTLTIERIDVNGNYEPSNCCFIQRNQQHYNTRKTRYETAFGETKSVAEWGKDPRCVVGYVAFRSRIAYGWKIEKALTTPARI